MNIIGKIEKLRSEVATLRKLGETIALVPTMGALHEGHLSLVDAATKQADRVVVSIFINPTQFAANEDLETYPRDESADFDKLMGRGVDIVFAPKAEEIYPHGFSTNVILDGPALGLESETRPHFFVGVATVVAKLLNIVTPDMAFFGEKDYQQLQVIKRLTHDLNIPTQIIGRPTIRQKDGLAMSSRNAYLSEQERKIAPRLHGIMQELSQKIQRGESVHMALHWAKNTLRQEGFRLDYIELCDPQSLAPLETYKAPARLLAAVYLGKTRLIDNIEV